MTKYDLFGELWRINVYYIPMNTKHGKQYTLSVNKMNVWPTSLSFFQKPPFFVLSNGVK